MPDAVQPGPDLTRPAAAPAPLPDRGPRYQETPADPTAPGSPVPAEPFNTVTAAFFVLIALGWMIRVRGRYARFPFLMVCMAILFVGGVGGTLYHAYRTRPLYFFLDVIPIQLLGIAGAAFLAVKLWKKRGWLYLLGGLLGTIAFGGLVRFVIPLPQGPEYRNLPVNVSYAMLAVLIVIPIAGSLVVRRGRGWGLIAAGLASFGTAWFCRLIDATELSPLPMGTHWLWHLFGAATTAFVIEYFYRVEREAGAASA